MLRLTFLLCLLASGLLCGQQTSPLDILFQDQTPLRVQVRDYPEAKKAFTQYRLKVISGSIVGASGIILLNHSLGSISPRNPHEWAITGLGVGLVTAGLFITKGAKKKRQEAKDIVKEKKAIAFQWQPNGLRISF